MSDAKQGLTSPQASPSAERGTYAVGVADRADVGLGAVGAWTARRGCRPTERRHALRAKLAAGELDELVFEACVFRAVYPNRNYLRFRDEDLEVFAASFAGQPFLRDHNAYELDARGGTVRASWLEGSVAHRKS